MSLLDLAGMVGVVMILIAYAGVQLGRLEPREAPALLLNLAGAGLILWSLVVDFNPAAFLMEACWALVALFGLAKLVWRRRARLSRRSRGRRRSQSRRPAA